MITGITIENFKGIRERVKLDFRPITLLFGANSAGKSSILHALHYAHEVLERHNLDPDQTAKGGPFVDLGRFKSLVHGRDLQSQVVIGVHFRTHGELYSALQDGDELPFINEYFADRLPDYANALGLEDDAGVELSIAYSFSTRKPYVAACRVIYGGKLFAEINSDGSASRVQLAHLDLAHPVLPTFSDWETSLRPVDEAVADNESVLSACLGEVAAYFQVVHSGMSEAPSFEPILLENQEDALPHGMLVLARTELPIDAKDDRFAEARLSRAFEAGLSTLIMRPIEFVTKYLREFRYLGPLRETVPRNFVAPAIEDPNRWASGLAAWDALERGSDEFVNEVGSWLGDEDRINAGCRLERRQYLNLDLADPLVRAMRDGRAFDDVDVDQRLDPNQHSVTRRIDVIPSARDIPLQPQDVGVGISQVIPVIVAALADRSRLVAIEQPELHIHPRLQATLADLFVEAIKRREHCFIIETHSEHLILRLLRRVRETENGKAPDDRHLRTDDLGIYYLKQENGSTQVSRIDVDVKGEFIQPWPDDFFEIDFFERFPDAR